jgi:hypothetical protein
MGVAASIAGLAVFAAQVTTSCQKLRTLLRDIKDAPEQVEQLMRELDLVTRWPPPSINCMME